MSVETDTHIIVPRELYAEEQLPTPVLSTVVRGESVLFRDNITLRPGQEDAWHALERASGGILNLACGKGKTVLMLKRIAQEQRAAIIIASASLLQQWKEEAMSFLNLTERDIGVIQGERMDWNRRLVLASIDTLALRAKENKVPWEMRLRFGITVYDEVHHLSAPLFVRTAPLFFGKRFGLSATVKREDGLEVVYMAHLGKVFFSDLSQDREARVYFQQIDTVMSKEDEESIKDRSGEKHHGKLCIWLGRQPGRNNIILEHVSKAATNGRKILLLSQSKEHVGLLHASIPGSGIIDGDIPINDRIRILRDHQITVAILSIAREGLNAVDLDTVMFLTPFKVWAAFQQGVGRTLRDREGKAESVAVVFWDYKIAKADRLCRRLMWEARSNGWQYIRKLANGKSPATRAKAKC